MSPSPEAPPRRYDTRFFLAPVAAGARCELHGEELVEARWLRPEVALRGHHASELPLLPPTRHTLRRLAGHPSLAGLREALGGQPAPTFPPRLPRERARETAATTLEEA